MEKGKLKDRLIYNKNLIILIWIIIFGVFLAYNYSKAEIIKLVPKCNFLTATGYLCPGCGGTRAVHNLLRGNIVKSLEFNFIPVIVGGYILLAFIEHSINAFFGFGLRLFIFREWMLWMLVIAVIIFGVVRNLV